MATAATRTLSVSQLPGPVSPRNRGRVPNLSGSYRAHGGQRCAISSAERGRTDILVGTFAAVVAGQFMTRSRMEVRKGHDIDATDSPLLEAGDEPVRDSTASTRGSARRSTSGTAVTLQRHARTLPAVDGPDLSVTRTRR